MEDRVVVLHGFACSSNRPQRLKTPFVVRTGHDYAAASGRLRGSNGCSLRHQCSLQGRVACTLFYVIEKVSQRVLDDLGVLISYPTNTTC